MWAAVLKQRSNLLIFLFFLGFILLLMHTSDLHDSELTESEQEKSQSKSKGAGFRGLSNVLSQRKEINGVIVKTSRKGPKTSSRCLFRAPLENRSIPFPCGHQQGFVSIVKSVCKTQLGNQLSSFATLVYFQVQYGLHAFLDPAQTRALGQVFDKAALGIGAFDFYRCGCHPGQQKWVRPLEVDRKTGVATRLVSDPESMTKNTLIGLGAHTTPVFLIKQVMADVRKRLVFRPRVMELAKGILTSIQEKLGEEENLLFVGIHARRGDKLSVWRRSGAASPRLGQYEAAFFRHGMQIMKNKYETPNRRVVFVVTSDNPGWVGVHFGGRNDSFISSKFIKASPYGPTSLGVDLAVLSLCSHTIMDYGTFGLWAGLLAGGDILAPVGYTRGRHKTPDMVWWEAAGLDSLTLLDVRRLGLI